MTHGKHCLVLVHILTGTPTFSLKLDAHRNYRNYTARSNWEEGRCKHTTTADRQQRDDLHRHKSMWLSNNGKFEGKKKSLQRYIFSSRVHYTELTSMDSVATHVWHELNLTVPKSSYRSGKNSDGTLRYVLDASCTDQLMVEQQR